eukprot:CAMPEP_0202891664 /NCGR_PEP_ID=MMETSP1392-20130828/1672_1 /ASSEMBLY_ACC=CAM_ASM_000868 /TAXON_ID=225041 /ORGANISM="Chlamydomonas chlamydogama, Strain SAG 11-48b" /LENGTH=248 /DNA_ID=CAMNT_0049575489 /DNA_START=295 /DNA_END=1037 /DNA_ORIENTATION=-
MPLAATNLLARFAILLLAACAGVQVHGSNHISSSSSRQLHGQHLQGSAHRRLLGDQVLQTEQQVPGSTRAALELVSPDAPADEPATCVEAVTVLRNAGGFTYFSCLRFADRANAILMQGVPEAQLGARFICVNPTATTATASVVLQGAASEQLLITNFLSEANRPKWAQLAADLKLGCGSSGPPLVPTDAFSLISSCVGGLPLILDNTTTGLLPCVAPAPLPPAPKPQPPPSPPAYPSPPAPPSPSPP